MILQHWKQSKYIYIFIRGNQRNPEKLHLVKDFPPSAHLLLIISLVSHWILLTWNPPLGPSVPLPSLLSSLKVWQSFWTWITIWMCILGLGADGTVKRWQGWIQFSRHCGTRTQFWVQVKMSLPLRLLPPSVESYGLAAKWAHCPGTREHMSNRNEHKAEDTAARQGIGHKTRVKWRPPSISICNALTLCWGWS